MAVPIARDGGPPGDAPRAQTADGSQQQGAGRGPGCSPRTITAYRFKHGGVLSPLDYAKLARVCHPHDQTVARQLAAQGGHTLASLGLADAAAAAPVRFNASGAHLVDSVVCAAAEALDVSPRAMRPALRAAVERMVALGMPAQAVLDALGPAAGAPKDKGQREKA